MTRPAPNTQTFTDHVALAAALKQAAASSRQRRALVLAGAEAWCRQAATSITHDLAFSDVLWVTAHSPEGARVVQGSQAGTVLGQEFDAVVFDAHSGFGADAFGAVTGTLCGGGVLLLLTPFLAEWPDFADPEHRRIAVAPYEAAQVTGRFLRRFVRVVRTAPGVVVVEQGRAVRAPERSALCVAKDFSVPEASAEEDADCRTQDQRQAVEAILRVATGRRRRSLVLTSDRGRGKSAALGIAAGRLLRRGLRRIVVTAPRMDASAAVFAHAQRALPEAEAARGVVRLGEACIEFVAPDELVLAPRRADLVLVDEAAAIPTPLLEQMLRRYARIAFATTIHGYEGTGRGFAVRFHQVLDQLAPGWSRLRMETPIRWASGDPLERFVFDALLLAAAPAPDTALADAQAGHCTFERLDRDRLAEDEPLLSELFGLLVLAHYQTTPNDLRHLLDGPNIAVHVMRYRGHVAATALVTEEGGFDAETAREIYAGRRRPRGHLIPQSLAAHMGLEDAARLRCARIMRIAVHPAAQGRGIGTRLLRNLVQQANEQGFDLVGASFGATGELLRFWERAGFLPARLGLTREAASGTHSVMVLHPVSDDGARLFATARARFLESLPHLLSDPLRGVDPRLVAILLRSNVPLSLNLDAQDWRDIVAFAFALRGYEGSLAPLWKLTCAVLTDPRSADVLSDADRDVLIAKVLQKRDWKAVAATLDLPGRAAVIKALRQAARRMVIRYGDEAVQREVARVGGR